jgi:uncharacterized membrane protein
MNFTSEPVLDPEEANLSKPKHRRRSSPPLGETDRAALRQHLSQAASPSVEFFVLSLLSGAVLGAGFVFDSPMLLVFGALLAPFLAPILGIALSAAAGSLGFFTYSFAGSLIGIVFVFLGGCLAGIASRLWVDLPFTLLGYQSLVTWDGILLLLFGVILSAVSLMRGEKRPLLPATAIAYVLYTPLCAAGFGTGLGKPDAAFAALITFLAYLILALLVGWLVFTFYMFFPHSIPGLIPILALLGGATAYTLLAGIPSVRLMPQVSTRPIVNPFLPSATPTVPTLPPPSATPTQTQVPEATLTPSVTPTIRPSETPTITFTPGPTPIWAKIEAESQGGIRLRSGPSFSSKVIEIIENGILVKLLNEVTYAEKVWWERIETVDGLVGWVVQSGLVTATPAPTQPITQTPPAPTN